MNLIVNRVLIKHSRDSNVSHCCFTIGSEDSYFIKVLYSAQGHACPSMTKYMHDAHHVKGFTLALDDGHGKIRPNGILPSFEWEGIILWCGGYAWQMKSKGLFSAIIMYCFTDENMILNVSENESYTVAHASTNVHVTQNHIDSNYLWLEPIWRHHWDSWGQEGMKEFRKIPL